MKLRVQDFKGTLSSLNLGRIFTSEAGIRTFESRKRSYFLLISIFFQHINDQWLSLRVLLCAYAFAAGFRKTKW